MSNRYANLTTGKTAKLPSVAGDLQPFPAPAAPPRKKAKRRSKQEWTEKFLACPPLPKLSPLESQRQRSLFERHDRVAVALRLPLSPTVDHFLVPARHTGRFIYTAEARAYKEVVEKLWRDHWNGWPPEPLTGRLRLLVVVHFAREGRGDIANREKALSDALTGCRVWEDDDQIDDMRFLRGSVINGHGAMDVTIEVIP